MAERSINHGHLPVIEHAGVLEDLGEIPGSLLSTGGGANARSGFRSCSFCGVGDSGVLVTKRAELPPAEEAIDSADGDLEVEWLGKTVRLKAKILGDGLFQVLSSVPLTERSGVLSGKFSAGNKTFPVSWREEARAVDALAFRLFMEDIPYGSKRTYSIAEAVGVSAKTAEKWIEEVQRLLAATDEVQELQGTKVGERS